jgi:signal peptidase I
MKHLEPPRMATWLLQHASSRYHSESLTGDLIESYRAGRSAGWYWRQALQAWGLSLRGRATHLWREYRSLLLFLLLMGGFRSAWADWVYVPSGSMNPTILEGDRVLIDKHRYGLRVPFSLIHLTRGENPERGDIIVFDSPRDGKSLVKRVIALPGDTVEMNGEQLIVNGVAAAYAAGDAREVRGLLRTTRLQDPAVLRESRVMPAHDLLLLPERRQWRRLGPLTVPEGMYFVLGDNRDNSADSRYIGFVPRRNIVGRASRVVLSLNPDHYYLPRAGRFLTTLQ